MVTRGSRKAQCPQKREAEKRHPEEGCGRSCPTTAPREDGARDPGGKRSLRTRPVQAARPGVPVPLPHRGTATGPLFREVPPAAPAPRRAPGLAPPASLPSARRALARRAISLSVRRPRPQPERGAPGPLRGHPAATWGPEDARRRPYSRSAAASSRGAT